MSVVFKKQTNIQIILDTKVDMSAMAEIYILYRSPSGIEGRFSAVLDVTNTKLVHQLVPGDIDEAGTWVFQAFGINSSDRMLGEKVYQFFDEPIGSLLETQTPTP